MKIVFVPENCIPFHGESLAARPLGGTETGVIRLAEALDRLGHRVFVFTPASNIPVTKPLYLPLSALGQIGNVDVLVSVRGIRPLFAGIQARASFMWTGDAHDQFSHLGIGDKRVITTLTGLWCVSSWHAQTLCEVSGFPASKAWVVRNGIANELFDGEETRNRKRLIYSSTPYRGLALLPELFSRIRSAVPDAELHVFSGVEVYEGVGSQNDAVERRYAPVFDTLRQTPGCSVHGNILQKQLAREFMRSGVLAYPNTFDETSCITAMEAMAGGCVVVTSDRGGLSETVGDAGILIKETPGSEEYNDRFVTNVVEVLSDECAWNKLSNRALARASEMSWNAVAQELTKRLQELLS
jgi:glycosyltransferase involved in cell wall biosynthesis